MNREGHENINFFYGEEVEHTPVYGKYTLFVVGLHSVEDIAKHLSTGSQPVEHIYFGANQSFPNLPVDDQRWSHWESVIGYFLDLGYWCTLDVDISCAEGLCEGSLVEHNRFVPMISAKLPYIRLLGYNATLKIDDRDFEATNPGVWCHSVHDLMNKEKFTDWSKYDKDTGSN